MGRAPCCDKANVKKGPWSPKEDSELKEYIAKYGTGGNWIALPQKIGLKRCGKSCRLRWLNYLRPNIKHGGFSEEEDNIICSFYKRIGSRWSIIAAHLPGRTDNDIKNYWNTMLKKKLAGKGKDYQARHLAAAKQQSQDLQSYDTSEVNTSPNIYGPQQQPVGVVHHMNINCMNGPYSNLGHGIIYQLFDKNCGSTISESSSSTEPATFQLNHQEVIDQEVSGCNTCVRNPHQGLERTPVDNPSNDCMTVMISTSPPVHASSSMNTSEMMQSIAYNQYSLDAASQISYETAASSVLMDARRMENHSKLENPSAAFAQNDNLLFFSASSSPGEENYESAWMKTISPENNNLGATVFSAEWSDLLLYSNISPGLQREACNYACDSINIY